MILQERNSLDGVCSTSGTSSPAGFFMRLGDRPLGTQRPFWGQVLFVWPRAERCHNPPLSWEVKDLE